MELIDTVNAFQKAATLEERLQLHETILKAVGPRLHQFIAYETHNRGFGIEGVDDIFQVTLENIAKGLIKFKGKSEQSFLKWCYHIARNKLVDAHRRLSNQHAEPMDPTLLEAVIEAGQASEAMLPGDRLDLDYAMNLLKQAKTPCFHFLWNHYIWGHDHEEIGDAFGFTKDAMRMRIERCLDTLIELLESEDRRSYAR